jgi:hypothetical protein
MELNDVAMLVIAIANLILRVWEMRRDAGEIPANLIRLVPDFA